MTAGQAKQLKWMVWEPVGWQKGLRLNNNECAFSVAEGGRSVMFRQCQRAPTVDIEGYGFCKTHGKKVQAALAMEQF